MNGVFFRRFLLRAVQQATPTNASADTGRNYYVSFLVARLSELSTGLNDIPNLFAAYEFLEEEMWNKRTNRTAMYIFFFDLWSGAYDF